MKRLHTADWKSRTAARLPGVLARILPDAKASQCVSLAATRIILRSTGFTFDKRPFARGWVHIRDNIVVLDESPAKPAVRRSDLAE